MNEMVRVGTEFEAEHVFETEASQEFARMVGDTNPMHHDEAAAAASRFGGLIVSGTETTARMMGLTARRFSELGPTLGLEFSFRFRRGVPMGARTIIRWVVTHIEYKEGLGHIATSTGTLTLAESGVVAVEATSKGVLLDKA
ncbi:MaoC family dehydratase [Acidiphilium acidophilum]|uniref:MaoC family dehydratase n=1 Tax=Acidiphilium acidophilum TaxID=76588 RepID=A0AAW9DRH8_ACIAO|nr:MaoC family dehydratase [Acidiphilium acidophilum]MDX5931506.1 MaoC family dehydratase [Acidiphilium acidophilum]GBR76578.1 dehydratase [Acidiphilium acidophilum DSM 700]